MTTTNDEGRQIAKVPLGPSECTSDRIDVAHVEGIDEDTHKLGCACGCDGDAVVIKEDGVDYAWVASTMDAERYMRGEIE